MEAGCRLQNIIISRQKIRYDSLSYVDMIEFN